MDAYFFVHIVRFRIQLFIFIAWSVCLSVVCYICAPCLNRLTYLHAIWQADLQGFNKTLC